MHSDVEFVQEEQRLRPAKSEVFRLHCDNTRIRTLTGFAPRYSLAEGLQATIDWFTQPENLRRYHPHVYAL